MSTSRTGAVEQILNFFRPLQLFLRAEMLGGTLLLLAAIVALLWANSPWAASYEWLFSRQISITAFGHTVQGDLVFWINDLLMGLFFLLVAMEIKRELVVGELNSLRKAALPVMAAVGGMVVPALIFTLVAHGGEAARGWGVPMATDIAFALGALRLMGKRIPTGLFAFLAALAIIDDLGAIIVIAVFYSESLNWLALGAAAGLTATMFVLNAVGVRRAGIFLIVGAPLWLAVLSSGIHATIAGVIIGLIMPLRRVEGSLAFMLPGLRGFLRTVEREKPDEVEVEAALTAVQHSVRRVEPPLAAMEHLILPYVTLVIVPLFALANAGVSLQGASAGLLLEPAALGVILGLVFGKPIGIVLTSLLAVRLGVASLPQGVTRQHLLGAGILGGIGFTMALFIAGLAFPPGSHGALFTEAKVGILTASMIAGGVGLLYLSRLKPASQAAVPKATAAS